MQRALNIGKWSCGLYRHGIACWNVIIRSAPTAEDKLEMANQIADIYIILAST